MSAVLQNQSPKEWTAEEFFNSPLSQNHELVEGKLVKTMPAGFIHGLVTQELSYFVTDFVKKNRLGVVVAAETGFILTGKTFRGADSAFISNEKLAEFGYPEGFFPTAPDLAVEVASPGNSSEELIEKVDLYLAAGCRLVWVVYPKRKTVYVYRQTNVINILRESEVLEGGDVLPNFSLPLAELFGNLPEIKE
ncbi:MAG TPA: Uma2 family endonuclease [Pyrinomonadaceae bacterium]|jgi:Uma2 family endonuclease